MEINCLLKYFIGSTTTQRMFLVFFSSWRLSTQRLQLSDCDDGSLWTCSPSRGQYHFVFTCSRQISCFWNITRAKLEMVLPPHPWFLPLISSSKWHIVPPIHGESKTEQDMLFFNSLTLCTVLGSVSFKNFHSDNDWREKLLRLTT